MNQNNELIYISSHTVIDAHYEQWADFSRHYYNPDGSPVLYTKVYVKNDDGISRHDCRHSAFIKHALAKAAENPQERHDDIMFTRHEMLPGFTEVQKGQQVEAWRASRHIGSVGYTGAHP